MAMPLPNPIVRALFLVKSDANMVVSDGHRLARIGLELIGLASEDEANDLLLKLGFFFGELGFGVVVVIVVVVGEMSRVEEKVFEGLGLG